MKVCKICKIEKDETDFNKRSNGKFRNECKKCKSDYLKAYRRNEDTSLYLMNENKEVKVCNTCGEEKPKDDFIKQKRICKICKSKYLKKYYEENKEVISEQSKLKYQENKEDKKQYSRLYAKNNRSKINQWHRKYKEEVLKHNPLYSIITSISSNIRRILKDRTEKKDFKTLSIIGCSKEELKIHIESLFQEEMNWENRDKWHIDHIIPLSLAQNKKEVIILNHFLNLRPMWSKDNIIKSNKIEDTNHPIYLKLLEIRKS